MTHFFLQPSLIYCSYLFEKYNRIARKPVLFSIYINVRGQFAFVSLACDCRGYHCRTEFVPYVILYYKYRSYTALFRSDYGTQISVIYISSLYTHYLFIPFALIYFYSFRNFLYYSVRFNFNKSLKDCCCNGSLSLFIIFAKDCF